MKPQKLIWIILLLMAVGCHDNEIIETNSDIERAKNWFTSMKIYCPKQPHRQGKNSILKNIPIGIRAKYITLQKEQKSLKCLWIMMLI